MPPAAPQRPIDELESLTSQPTRRRFPKKKKKTDYTTEIIVGGVITAAGILLFMAYAAFTSEDRSKHGYDAIEPEKPVESVRTAMEKKFIEELRKRDKERERGKEKEKKTATDPGSRPGPRRTGTDNAGRFLPHALWFRPAHSGNGFAGPGKPPGVGAAVPWR